MMTGRSQEQRQELAEVITRETARVTKCPLEHVQVVIIEHERSHWAVGGVIAKPTAQKTES
ncbi:4-oxalocrotonate tautomerase [compost metagenome]